jgi:hypothetical protein
MPMRTVNKDRGLATRTHALVPADAADLRESLFSPWHLPESDVSL